MTRKLYQEYFGGALVDTANAKNNMLLNRWQYLCVNGQGLTADGFKCTNINALTDEGVAQEAVILLPSYEKILGVKDFEDSGSKNFNAIPATDENVESFSSELESKGYYPNRKYFVSKDLYDKEYKIQNILKIPKVSGPRGAFLELTSACNLECRTCYNEFARSDNNRRQLSSGKIFDILEELNEFGCNHIALTGGETTLAPAWKEIALKAKAYEMAIRFYTCGVYENHRNRVISDIIDVSPEEVRITYNGLKARHDSFRVRKHTFNDADRETFSEITSTVSDLLEGKQHVKLNYVLCEENRDDVAGFLGFVQERFIQKSGVNVPVNIGPLRSYGSAYGSVAVTKPTPITIYTVNQVVESFREKYGMSILTVFDCLGQIAEEKRQRLQAKIGITPRPYLYQGCGLGKLGIGIAFNGEAQICGIMGNEMKENLIKIVQEDPAKYARGGINLEDIKGDRFTNVLDNSIGEIWQSSPIFNYFQGYYEKEQCLECPQTKYRVQCGGICPGMALRDSGDIRKGDRSCPVMYL
jgi:radical SAM protein with 4Fe4S-binding SPASM domain